ncbi:MAG: TniQ family protein [Sulfitobacter sp.]|uniref:TniQ family protein n=1 Tax=Sulfitobacter sp. TaxID=1903071 RepID=UPI00329A17BD
MPNLPIASPTPALRETLYSYLARLAAVWKTDVRELAFDIGAPFKKLLNQDPDALEALADWADLAPNVMDELLSWTGVRAGDVRMEFRDELFVSRAIRNPVMRGCPVCLREDASAVDGQAVSSMVMRGDWQYREVNLCVGHGHPLIQLWKSEALQDRFDIAARLLEIDESILSGALDRPRQEPSSYDLWLDQRLQSGSDQTCLRDQSVHAIAPLCRLLGQAVLNVKTSESDNTSNSVHTVGFNIAVQGNTATRAALDQIAATATKSSDEPGKIFGPLYNLLNRDYLNDPDFGLFREILRECVLDHWPRAAGEVVLGQTIPERRLHSLLTASKKTGIGPAALEHFLIEAGAFREDDKRPQGRKLFDAKKYDPLLTEIPTLVGPIAMRTAMGATRQELEALEEEELLIPRTKVAKVKNPWCISDGIAFVAELTACSSIPVDEGDKGWETLLFARRRREVSLVDLINGIRDQTLKAGQRAGVKGFHGVVVQISEVNSFAGPRPKAHVEVLDQEFGKMSAAEFGRLVGLRNNGVFMNLVETGYVNTRLVKNPRTGQLQHRMTLKDITEFHRRFVTLTTLVTETGQHRNTLKGILAAGRVTPFSPDGQDYGAVYLRADVTKLI